MEDTTVKSGICVGKDTFSICFSLSSLSITIIYISTLKIRYIRRQFNNSFFPPQQGWAGSVVHVTNLLYLYHSCHAIGGAVSFSNSHSSNHLLFSIWRYYWELGRVCCFSSSHMGFIWGSDLVYSIALWSSLPWTTCHVILWLCHVFHLI